MAGCPTGASLRFDKWRLLAPGQTSPRLGCAHMATMELLHLKQWARRPRRYLHIVRCVWTSKPYRTLLTGIDRDRSFCTLVLSVLYFVSSTLYPAPGPDIKLTQQVKSLLSFVDEDINAISEHSLIPSIQPYRLTPASKEACPLQCTRINWRETMACSQKAKRTAAGIRTWSPTVLLIRRFTA